MLWKNFDLKPREKNLGGTNIVLGLGTGAACFMTFGLLWADLSLEKLISAIRHPARIIEESVARQ